MGIRFAPQRTTDEKCARWSIRAQNSQPSTSSFSSSTSDTSEDGVEGSTSQPPRRGAPRDERVSNREIVQSPPVPPCAPPQRTASRTVNGALTPMAISSVSDKNLGLRCFLLDRVSVNLDNIRASTFIVHDRKNVSSARYVLDLAHNTSETEPAVASLFKTLTESQSSSEKQDAAERIETAMWLKIFELEETTQEADEKRTKKREKGIGFGTRVRDYKKRIANTMDNVKKYDHPQVELIGIEDLKRREQEQQPLPEEAQPGEAPSGRPQGQGTLFQFRFGRDARRMNVDRMHRGFEERRRQQSSNNST